MKDNKDKIVKNQNPAPIEEPKVDVINIGKISKEAFGVESWIPLKELEVDIIAQRNLMESQVKKIMSNFTPESFGRITVSKREETGKYMVQDGQHRAEALRRLGFNEAPCIVVNSPTVKEEATNFIKINLGSASVSALDKYRIGVTANVPEYLNIKECVESVGLEVGNGTGKISAVASIGSYINAPSKEEARAKKRKTMKTALEVLKETAGVDYINQTSILGMCIFCRHYIDNGNVEKEMVIERFKNINLQELIQNAQAWKNNSTKGRIVTYLAYLLVEEYNKGLKGRKKLLNSINVIE